MLITQKAETKTSNPSSQLFGVGSSCVHLMEWTIQFPPIASPFQAELNDPNRSHF